MPPSRSASPPLLRTTWEGRFPTFPGLSLLGVGLGEVLWNPMLQNPSPNTEAVLLNPNPPFSRASPFTFYFLTSGICLFNDKLGCEVGSQKIHRKIRLLLITLLYLLRAITIFVFLSMIRLLHGWKKYLEITPFHNTRWIHGPQRFYITFQNATESGTGTSTW